MKQPRGISIRTTLCGRVRDIATDAGPVARVDLRLNGGDTLSAFITRNAIDELGLGPGDEVFALIKTASIDTR